ncbi:hypothetical protein WG68_12360 [Arsukibacterium ikkense]|uniref:Tetratricopeptide repeat-like domain-containing protein n=1 Tax=Arsukibacterium ikkense TaxID=336831 RepID=A0A0M2V264_9GAMM|nr:tetratricopeptide repeat protein [Arsukibacterium ikkense]KKO44937.1 hypothetical protein WG68_12360 [Arsukibacterium ikkense]
MSVINKMLQDLEQRQQPAAVRPNTMAPQPHSNAKAWYLWLALPVVCLVLLAWLWLLPALAQRPLLSAEPGQTLPNQPVLAMATSIKQETATLTAQMVTDNRQLTAIGSAGPAQIVAALNSGPTKAEAATPPGLPATRTQQPLLTVTRPAAVKPQATIEKQHLSAGEQQQNMQLRANASEAAGDTSAAIAIWQQIAAQQPAEPEAYLNLARLWLQQQQMVTARQVLLQARQQGVQSAEINLQLAQLAVRQGQWQQALAFLPDQFELAAEPEYFGFKATVLQQLEQFAAALSWYQRLAQLQPEQARWSLGAALSSEQLGQPLQANQYYQKAWQYRQALSASSHDFIQQRLKATEP